MSFGNLRDEPLEDVVARMREFKHFKKRPEHCIVALDEEFIGDYLDPSIDERSTPYPIQNNSCYAADCSGCGEDSAAT
jgi:hypothetical protein